MIKAEFDATINRMMDMLDTVHSDIEKLDRLLRGSEGRNGLVKDVNELKSQSRLASGTVGVVVGIIASIVSSYVIHVLVG